MTDDERAQARRLARARTPWADFSRRAEPCWELADDRRVAADCTTYDPQTPRLWRPRNPR